MSFTPLKEGFSSSLLGIADPGKFIDPMRLESDSFGSEGRRDQSLTERRIHASKDSRTTLRYTIIIIIISAIIFVTVIAIYDVIRTIITNFYAEAALKDPKAQVSDTDRIRTEIANYNALLATIVFAIITICIALIIIPILIWML